MSNSTLRRIQKECREVVTSDEMIDLGITLEILDESSFSHIQAEVRGPPDTPYEGGRFKLDVVFPDEYPFKPLKAQFITKVWHPNVSSVTGLICLDALKDKWSASFSLRTVLLSIQNLLASPEPSDPQDAVVAKQYMSQREEFDKTARFWAQYFASAPGDKDEHLMALVKKVAQQTKSETQSIALLSCNSWDSARAIDYAKST